MFNGLPPPPPSLLCCQLSIKLLIVALDAVRRMRGCSGLFSAWNLASCGASRLSCILIPACARERACSNDMLDTEEDRVLILPVFERWE